ncbi:hypothetical protein ER308_05840 [Egibacter rhizosphaerae]|uniref:Uncharacterized protein n=1 Tax=Egibacter rhizosphaerae TaxID=1670831 RepID=A0A411YD38_9ACTN|nr:hypothetical protein [Egibacter rhizosphaerae]QBI19109.1 hypothetical protein ER308_05840 [Egibacter rhizosphaerae]
MVEAFQDHGKLLPVRPSHWADCAGTTSSFSRGILRENDDVNLLQGGGVETSASTRNILH